MFVAWSGLLSWVQITDVGRSLYIGSFCPAMTSLSRCLEEAAFSISITSSVFIFLWLFSTCIMDTKKYHVFAPMYYGHSFFYCFHFMSFVKDMFRDFRFAFCVSEVFPMFFESCVEVSIGSSYIKS